MTKNLQARIPLLTQGPRLLLPKVLREEFSCTQDAAQLDPDRLSLALRMHMRRKCAENPQFANIVFVAE